MHHFLTGTLCALLLSGVLVSPVAAAAASEANAADAAKIVNSFALKAVGGFSGVGTEADGEVKDFFFSPYSIISALGMTWAGAVGETKTDMALALGFGNDENFHENLGALSKHLTSIMNGEDGLPLLTAANRIWIAKDMVTKTAFANTLRKDYGAAAARVNFQEPDIAKWRINSWVEQQTQGRIRDLIQELLPDSRMVLTNAVYFKGAWEHAFPEENTEDEPFYSGSDRNEENATKVSMMKQVQELSYAELDGVKLVCLPYAGGADMLIALPSSGNSTGDIINTLMTDGSGIENWLKELTPHRVNLWLPRFKMDESYELKDILSALGMERAFGRFADFSAMAENEDKPLHIDSVVHKTFLDVNERETEAAAATGVIMMRTTSLRPPLPMAEFHADHPFMFFILDRQTNAILFMGRKSF